MSNKVEGAHRRSKRAQRRRCPDRHGYAKVASLMANQHEFAIVRRFRVLNMQNLLYLQAEITHLEADIARLAERDARLDDRKFYARDWLSLSEDDNTEQWDKFKELRKRLNEYNNIVIQQVQLAAVEKPRPYDLQFLRKWFQRRNMGSFPLRGLDKDAWVSQHEDDLLAIKARSAPDAFSRWFTETIVPAYHHLLGEKFKDPMNGAVGVEAYHYEEATLQSILRICVTVVASLLPLGSIIVLYFVKSNGVRLAIIAAFSALFALALAIMTRSRTVDIFTATAAFGAVNVVFLTNNACNLATNG